MKRWTIVFLAAAMLLALGACGGKDKAKDTKTQSYTETTPVYSQPIEPVVEPVTEPDEFAEELYGYRFALPRQYSYDGTGDGMSLETDAGNVFIYRLDSREFESWDGVLEQYEERMPSALYQAYRFGSSVLTATAEEPFTNEHGVEMMRVTGDLKLDDGDTMPYIAYYYVTDENYVRFIIAVNYDNETDAAEMIDYMAAHLEKA